MDELNTSESESGKGRKIGIAALALLLVGSVGLYFSGFSLKSMLFGISSESGDKVGVVKSVSGKLKRQPKDSLEFLDASVDSDLYNEDTAMTGPDDHATIELFDGSSLEMDPGSLVRLSFEKVEGQAGIERRLLVDIVAGNVRGDVTRPKLLLRKGGQTISRPVAAPATPGVEPVAVPSPDVSPVAEISPTPEPSPTPEGLKAEDLKLTQPKAGQVLTIPAGQKSPLKQPFVFESPSRPSAEIQMVLKNAEGKEILQKTVTATDGRGGLLATFEKPGKYTLELRNPDGSPIGEGSSTSFRVAPEFVGIDIEPPLVGGEIVDSNKFNGKRLQDFEVTLRWKPIDGVEQYRVTVKNKDGIEVLNQKVRGRSLVLAKGKVSTEAMTYQIRADLLSGYVATSKKENFLFNFASPAQTLPQDGAVVSLGDPEVMKQNGIFFSWQRTTFTLAYEFEIALDPKFANVMKKITLKQQDNFLVFRNMKPRDYWWRVRAVSGDLKSPPGQGFKITVTP